MLGDGKCASQNEQPCAPPPEAVFAFPVPVAWVSQSPLKMVDRGSLGEAAPLQRMSVWYCDGPWNAMALLW